MRAGSTVAMGLWCVACRPTTDTHGPAPTTVEAAPAAAPAQALHETSDVIASVDGVPISAEELEVGLRLSGQPLTDPAARSTVLLFRIESQLLVAEAERMELGARVEEIDGALDHLAEAAGITRAQMQEEVEKTGVTFAAYRREIAAQLAGGKVLLRRVGGESAQEMEAQRARIVGCLRAGAKIIVNDATLSLPDNPLAAPAQIAGFTFTFAGKPAIPEAELRTAAQGAAKDAAAAGATLCDALERTEVVLTDLYLERGHLDARVRMQWPAAATSPNTYAIRIDAGLPNVIGTIAFDVADVPDADRIDTKSLRKRVDALAGPGNLATSARVKAVTDEVERAFRDAGFARAQTELNRSPGKNRTRLDIVYHPR